MIGVRMNQTEFAKKIGVTRQAVSKMKKEGLLVLKNGKIDPLPSISNLEKVGRLEKAKKIDRSIKEEDINEYTTLRTKYLAEQHRKRKLENDERERILIRLDEAKELVEKFLSPIIRDMDSISNDFRIAFPNATHEMIKWLDNYINDIRIKSQKRTLEDVFK